MFNKILVANRGEIAIRVMRAARELGIKTVAIYSDADENALHAKYADESFPLFGVLSKDTYLNQDKIIEIAKKAKAEAIHPGYGFLSENPVFAQRCKDEGIVFIGPSPSAIELMGSKIEARKVAKKAGAPVVPGSDQEVKSVEEAKELAKEIGYPVMIKASAGGGGIGLRVVHNEKILEKEFNSARSIALSAFGDGTVFVEKYIEAPRHIEIQILADNYGNIVYFPERECTIQRRHQKLIEESPSPVIVEALRRKLGEIAVNIAKSINYVNAGTVEFIYSQGKYYFLEVNTRIQVEHPVTEVVTGIDLVKEQIKIAAGEPLSFTQQDIKINCWAIECRINAEDPLNKFLPSPGTITGYRSPGGIGVRVDSGIHHSYTIPPYYDSMISKLIAFGKDRDEAIARAKRALYEYIIVGVKTNIPFHKAVMNNHLFLKGDLSTHFIEEQQHLQQEMEKIIAEEKALSEKLESIFKEAKKPEIEKDKINNKKIVAAIMSAFLHKAKASKKEVTDKLYAHTGAITKELLPPPSCWKIAARFDLRNLNRIR